MQGYIPILAMGDDDIMALMAISGGLTIGFLAIVCHTVKSIVKARMMETSRREIAAYIAEGSITPEEGERLLQATPPRQRCGD